MANLNNKLVIFIYLATVRLVQWDLQVDTGAMNGRLDTQTHLQFLTVLFSDCYKNHVLREIRFFIGLQPQLWHPTGITWSRRLEDVVLARHVIVVRTEQVLPHLLRNI